MKSRKYPFVVETQFPWFPGREVVFRTDDKGIAEHWAAVHRKVVKNKKVKVVVTDYGAIDQKAAVRRNVAA